MSGFLVVSFQTKHGEEKCYLFVIFLSLGKCNGKSIGSLEKVWMDKWQGEGGWMCLALGAKRQQITWPCKTHPLPRPCGAHCIPPQLTNTLCSDLETAFQMWINAICFPPPSDCNSLVNKARSHYMKLQQ